MPFVLIKAVLLCCMFLFVQFGFGQERNISLEHIISEMKLHQKGKFPYGFKPNTDREKVKAEMKKVADLFQEDSLFVTYSVYLSDDNADFGDISFDFPKGKLTSASIETYLSSKEAANKSFNQIKANYDNLYGSGEFREETFYWKFKKKGRTLEIQLWQVNYEGDEGYGIDYLYY